MVFWSKTDEDNRRQMSVVVDLVEVSPEIYDEWKFSYQTWNCKMKYGILEQNSVVFPVLGREFPHIMR